MPTSTLRTSPLQGRYANDDERWRAVVRRDPRADSEFFYSVKTTGVYCRPSCAARRARRENVHFHPTAAAAERAGFRPCRRCRPRDASITEQHRAAVRAACRQIEATVELQDLKSLARTADLSPSHFQRIFKSLTGVTPKAYALAHRSLRVQRELTKSKTVTAAAYRAGFVSSGRFYSCSTELLGMTPKSFRAGGKGVAIRFAVGECSLGAILVAATERGICTIAIGDDPNRLVHDLQDRFPAAELIGGDRKFEQLVARAVGLVERPAINCELPLDVQGTAFQQRVWQELRKIPRGQTMTYTQLARNIGRPRAVRAVASAVAANRIAVAIPCHRVIRTDGSLSGYRWGVERKATLIERERVTE